MVIAFGSILPKNCDRQQSFTAIVVCPLSLGIYILYFGSLNGVAMATVEYNHKYIKREIPTHLIDRSKFECHNPIHQTSVNIFIVWIFYTLRRFIFIWCFVKNRPKTAIFSRRNSEQDKLLTIHSKTLMDSVSLHLTFHR